LPAEARERVRGSAGTATVSGNTGRRGLRVGR